MTRLITIMLMLCACMFIQAQSKHDANWVFGDSCGIFFNQDTASLFKSNCNGFETTASVSDKEGNLLFYVVNSGGFYSPFMIVDGNHNLVSGGGNIIANESVTNAIVILPLDTIDRYFRMYHIGAPSFINFPNSYCLYNTLIEIENNEIRVVEKNKKMTISPIEEKLSAIRHANGKDWYVIVKEKSTTQLNSSATFYVFLDRFDKIDTILSYGFINQDTTGFFGQMKSSPSGEFIALVSGGVEKKADILNFDRCSGQISTIKQVFFEDTVNLYGVEFSKNSELVYLASWKFNDEDKSNLYQISVNSNDTSRVLLYSSDKIFGQLQLAKNGHIYIANQSTPYSSESFYNEYNQNLSVIHQPDSAGLACDFRPFSFYLGDSSKSSLGLPNFPNYRLGALSIYEADAGKDTVLCIDSTVNQKVVQLGSPKVDGVQYQWYPNYNLSSDTVAQPLAFPDSSTMYYLMLSDTTITNACKTRLDSVYVEVRKCISSVHGQLSTDHSVKVFPNPASSEIKIESEKQKIQNVSIYDVAGKALLSPFEGGVCSHCEQAGDEVIINIKELSQGIYFIQTQLANGQTTINKLVKQ